VPAHAQGVLTAQGDSPGQKAEGALAILSFSVVPNETASSMNVDAGGGDVRFSASQLGGAFTVSDEFSLYMEGFVGYARYDPRFVFSNGARTTVVAPRWTSVAGTVGVDWDIPITDQIVLRPIANFSLGHVESDVSLAGRFLTSETGVELEFLENGRLNAVGYGGALMLDYELYRKDYEVDAELRYTHIRLDSIGGTSQAAKTAPRRLRSVSGRGCVSPQATRPLAVRSVLSANWPDPRFWATRRRSCKPLGWVRSAQA